MSSEVTAMYAAGSIEVWPDGRWDVCLPNGEHRRGKAADLVEALDAGQREYDSWIMDRVRRGHPIAGGRFVFSLK